MYYSSRFLATAVSLLTFSAHAAEPSQVVLAPQAGSYAPPSSAPGGVVNAGIGIPYPSTTVNPPAPADANHKLFPDVDITLGVGVAYGPRYSGGGHEEFAPIPMIDISWGAWNLGASGLHYTAFEKNNISIGAALGYDGGRERRDLPANKKGVGKVDGSAVGTMDASYTAFQFLEASLSASNYFADDGGATVTAELEAGVPIYKQIVMGSVGVSTTWASDEYMQRFYGVDARQASRSGLKRYTPESGVHDVTLSGGINYNFAPSWNYMVNGGVKFLQNTAADSPIVEDSTQPFVISGITYSF